MIVEIGQGVGYGGIFLLVAGETAGALIPGETALILGGVVASRGDLRIELVIAAGAAGAIVGDQIGFQIGERGLRRLLGRGRRWSGGRDRLLQEGERFFERHGPKAVFLARWVPGLRLIGSWFAGAARMRWQVFTFWNVLGGIAWSTSIGGGSYLIGEAAGGAFGIFGFALGTLIALVVGVRLAHRHGLLRLRR